MARAKPKEKQTEPSYLKVPPQNLEAEQAILGAILIHNDAMNQVVDVVAPEDFYREAHAAIFEGMVSLYHQGDPIDIITISEFLTRKGLLENLGGVEIWPPWWRPSPRPPASAITPRWSRTTRSAGSSSASARRISDACFQPWENTDDLLDQAERSIFDIAEQRVREGFDPLKEVIKTSFAKLEAVASHEGHITGVPTDFRDFDRLTAGLQPSDLIIIAGRPSMGKTALALNIGYNAATLTKKAVAVFSLEMSKLQLGIRLLGFDAGVDASKLRSGFLRDDDWGKLLDAANRLSELPIFIDDSSGISVLEMKAKCRRLKKKNDLTLVIVDYLQLIQGRRSAESRQLEISEISRSLKALAKELNVPVMALSQLNRKVEDRQDKRPQLADLRESGAIEQDADVIAFIYRDEVYNPYSEKNRNVAEIIIAKQRNGPTDTFRLTFQRDITRFRDYIPDEGPLS